MNILNQAAGNPIFPSKISGTQDSAEHVPTSLSLPTTNTAKLSQSSILKNTPYTIASGSSRLAQSTVRAYIVEPKTTAEADMMQRPKDSISNLSGFLNTEEQLNYLKTDENRKIDIQAFIPGSVSSRLGNEKYTEMDDNDVESFKYSSQTRDVLVVSVSSAVELNNKQIELITRKMQKVTGFRRLRLVNIIDPSLIAGFVVDYSSDGSQVIDLSVKGQLATLAAKLETKDKNGQKWNFPNGIN